MLRTRPFIACLVLLLGACAAPKPELEPPTIRIVELKLGDGEAATPRECTLVLRLRNTTEALLPTHQLELDFKLDGRSAGHFERAVEVAIPSLSGEILRFDCRLDPRQQERLAELAAGGGRQIPYSLDGHVRLDDQTMDVYYEGWLSNNPGKPGSYR